jgi:pimeloyl-ACP methyl ester carboxylesterase
VTTRVARAKGIGSGIAGTARIHTITGGGHLATLDDPEALAEAVLELLAAT